MKYTVKKGHHYASRMWLRIFPIVIGNSIEKEVIYHASCAYDLKSDDQDDWCKTFGRSFSLDPEKHNVRFANRYDLEGKLNEIGYYFHEFGKKKYGYITSCFLERPVRQRLVTTNYKGKVKARFIITYASGQQRSFTRVTEIPYRWYSWIGWKQYVFFGGNTEAPHDYHITLTNPNLNMKKALESLKNYILDLPALIAKHWFYSLGFFLIIPLVIIWSVYSERDQWPAINYLWAVAPILAYLIIVLPLLRWAVKNHK